jgi:hypothetical protein
MDQEDKEKKEDEERKREEQTKEERADNVGDEKLIQRKNYNSVTS